MRRAGMVVFFFRVYTHTHTHIQIQQSLGGNLDLDLRFCQENVSE